MYQAALMQLYTIYIAKLTSIVVIRALWPHDTLRMSGYVDATVLHHMRLARARLKLYTDVITYLDMYQVALI